MFSCPARIIDKDIIELPCGREFLSRPTTAKGDVFVSAYFDLRGAVCLYKVVEMSRLGKNFEI